MRREDRQGVADEASTEHSRSQEPYRKGEASHSGPESCVSNRKVAVEALTGENAGPVLSCENKATGVSTLLTYAEDNTTKDEKGQPFEDPAQSET